MHERLGRMSASENQIVVYQPNETVRATIKCCHCANFAICQIQFPMKDKESFAIGAKGHSVVFMR